MAKSQICLNIPQFTTVNLPHPPYPLEPTHHGLTLVDSVTSKNGVAGMAGKSIKKPFSRIEGNSGNTRHTRHTHHGSILLSSSGGRGNA